MKNYAMSNLFPVKFVTLTIILSFVSCASSNYTMYKEIKSNHLINSEEIQLYYEYPHQNYIVIGKYATSFSEGISRSKIHQIIKKEILKRNGHAGVIVSDENYSDNWTTSSSQSAGIKKTKLIVYFIYFPEKNDPDQQ